ncbi:MAG: type II 3-dehydroquinate dehydratase [Desulfomonilia bacterium]
MVKILMINGPNLNLLGTRETQVYGTTTLHEIEQNARRRAGELGMEIAVFQSNHEGAIIDRIHAARDEQVQGILINPGGYTHTSVAIRDALKGVGIPFIEVHLSNIYAREEFRSTSLISGIASGIITGLGPLGYLLAIEALHELITQAR